MELRQLKYFKAVAEELHFGRAAQRLNISQPPLSMQIRNLEDELGFELFHRTNRKVELSDAGREFLDGARRVLAQAEQAVQQARQVARGLAGSLVIGFMGPAMDGPLPEAVKAFRDNYPRISLTFEEMSSAEQVAALKAGAIDLGVVRAFGRTPPGVASMPFWREEYVLAMATDHRLAGKDSARPDELADEELILFPRQMQPELYDAVIAAFHAQGVTPRVGQHARTKQNALALAAAGLGLAIVPKTTAQTRPGTIKAVELKADLPLVEISLAWKLGRQSAALQNLVAVLVDHSGRCQRVQQAAVQALEAAVAHDQA